MKNTNRKIVVLSAGLLGLSTTFGIVNSAVAAPRNNDVRQERRDVKEARKEVKQERKEARRADTPYERRQERRDVREAREELREERQELRRENRPGQRYGQQGWNNRPNYDRPYNGGYNRPGYDRPGNGSNYGQTFTGTVTRVRSDQSFDIRVNNTTYNVFTNSFVPRGLSNGDIVRVSGVRADNNDIRDARVALINNR